MRRAGTTAVLTGAGRGFGRGIAQHLALEEHLHVIGVSRSRTELETLREELGAARFTPVVADATLRQTAQRLLHQAGPELVVANAGAVPFMAPLHKQTFDEFERCWRSDTKQMFEWAAEALITKLPEGAVFVAMSSAAVLQGSPLSGGYAPAKSAIRFIASYAAKTALQLDKDLRFATLLPQLSPSTGVGQAGVAAYASQRGLSPEEFTAQLGGVLTPQALGQAVGHAFRAARQPRNIATGEALEFVVTPDGVTPLGASAAAS